MKNFEGHSLRDFRYDDNWCYKAHESKGEDKAHGNIYLNQLWEEVLLQEVNEKYCNCDLDHMLSRARSSPSFTSLPLDNMISEAINRNLSQNVADPPYDKKKMSKSDYNLELLKDFNYISETRKSETDGSDIIIYIWKHLNWNKEFTRTWNLLDHALVHLGVKPFTWSMCSKGFTQKGNLLKHMKVHSLPDVDDRKRYFCNLCNSSYTERYNYKVKLTILKIIWILSFIYLYRLIWASITRENKTPSQLFNFYK